MNVRRQIIMLTTTVVVIVGSFVGTLLSDNRPALGLDLQGGISIVLFPVEGTDTSGLDTSVDIIRRRVDGLGIAEPEVQRQGDTIVVDLPGVEERDRAEEQVGQTAELRFRPVLGTLPWATPIPTTTIPTTTVPGATTTVAPGETTTVPPPDAQPDAPTPTHRPRRDDVDDDHGEWRRCAGRDDRDHADRGDAARAGRDHDRADDCTRPARPTRRCRRARRRSTRRTRSRDRRAPTSSQRRRRTPRTARSGCRARPRTAAIRLRATSSVRRC